MKCIVDETHLELIERQHYVITAEEVARLISSLREAWREIEELTEEVKAQFYVNREQWETYTKQANEIEDGRQAAICRVKKLESVREAAERGDIWVWIRKADPEGQITVNVAWFLNLRHALDRAKDPV